MIGYVRNVIGILDHLSALGITEVVFLKYDKVLENTINNIEQYSICLIKDIVNKYKFWKVTTAVENMII